VSQQPGELKEELRGNFLFESLTDEQVDWLIERGTVEVHDAGTVVYDQGELADSFYVLLEGEVQLLKRLDGNDVVLSTSDLPGSYAGAMRAFIQASQDESYVSRPTGEAHRSRRPVGRAGPRAQQPGVR
jgi:CRP-like cAMP-binding protein